MNDGFPSDAPDLVTDPFGFIEYVSRRTGRLLTIDEGQMWEVCWYDWRTEDPNKIGRWKAMALPEAIRLAAMDALDR